MNLNFQILIFISTFIIWGQFSFIQHANAFGKKRKENPCPQITILDPGKINLTDTEVRLICGDDQDKKIGKAWRDIPLAQAESNFKTFLQDRGYFFPKFTDLTSGITLFDPGKQTKIQKVSGKNLPKSVSIHQYRFPLNEILTPKKVSEVRDWVRKKLREEGFACPKVEAIANPETGEILVEWQNPNNEETSSVGAVLEDGNTGLGTGVIRRYDAFHTHQEQKYSLIRTEITAKRTSSEHLTIYHNLEPICNIEESKQNLNKQISLKETVQVGLPRFVSISVGANTESILLGRASWSHTRLGRAGSLVEVAARGSLKEQSIKAHAKWYAFTFSPATRQYLAPSIQVSHENELHYELIGLKTRMLWQNSLDFEKASLQFGIGPGWKNQRQIDGIGPAQSKFASIEAEATYFSHLFEYYLHSPRTGQRLSLTSTFVPTSIYGSGNPFQVKLESTWLFNPSNFEPPLFVFGIRTKAFYTILPPGTSFSDIPIEFREWLGGGRDARGFGRFELPKNDYGSRLGFFAGTEIRIPHLLPAKFEPFFLADFSWLWSGPNTLSETFKFYWNPGFGIRWESPVGALRASASHGYVPKNEDPNLSHWQVYISLGEEF